MLHSSLSRVQAVSWKQQHRSKKLGPATQTQSVLHNYNRNAWLLLRLLGTWRSNRPGPAADLWSSVFCLWLRRGLPASHGPLPGQTKPSSHKVDASKKPGGFWAIIHVVPVGRLSYGSFGPSRTSDILLQTRNDIFRACFVLSAWKITFLLMSQQWERELRPAQMQSSEECEAELVLGRLSLMRVKKSSWKKTRRG